MKSNTRRDFCAKFEDIEHEQFGEDGFDDAVKQISAIEGSLRLAHISQFTKAVHQRSKHAGDY